MEIYTYSSNPFRVGGRQYDIIKTNVEEYERINIGRDYFAIVVKNHLKDLYHVALENCGAIIWTDSDKENAIKTVKHDVETGDEEIMKKQIKQGLFEREKGILLENNEFFRRFKK